MSSVINTSETQDELSALKKENRTLSRRLKEVEYLVSSYEQYAVFQKSIYESLKKQKDEQDIYLRLIFSNAPDIILVFDTSMTYVLGTKKNMRKIGVDTDTLQGKDFSAIFEPVMQKSWINKMLCDLQEVINTGEAKKYSSKVGMIHGKTYCYEINMLPFTNATGVVDGVIIIMHDETELHSMVLAAESSNRAKTNFLARISHEIRTPMNAIAGMSELILREQTSGLVREHALGIKQASGNLMAIINDILDFSKIESGKLDIIETEYKLSALLNGVISIFRTRIMEKQIFFVANVDSNTPNTLIGDEIRIRQILLNLLSNAFKYCERGFISIHVGYEKLTEDNATIVFDVSDSGIGIRAEDQKKLFTDFTQLDRIANKNIEGTGLGLVITKNLCEAMGGNISVYSVYGTGSTFTVRIPQKFNEYEKYAHVENAKELRALVYETRAAYCHSIICSIDDLGVNCTHVTNRSMFLDELNTHSYTHVFASSFLYENTEKFVDTLGIKATIVLIAEYGERYNTAKNIHTLEMPAQTIAVANILNGVVDAQGTENQLNDRRFIAPSARILVVDDLTTNLRVAEGLMLPYKMQIDTCKSGQNAIDFVMKNSYDIIFMDHMMPEMDGVEAALKIRELECTNAKTVPIIALTANAVSGVREMFLQNGMNDFLAKPIELVKLNSILETYLPKEKLEQYIETDKSDVLPSFEIHGIDIKSGVFMTGGNIGNYLRVLSAFYKDGMKKIDELRDNCAQGDMKRYAENAHAIKGASASVGAAKLSNLAKTLELAARNRDANYILQNNDNFISELRTLLGNISFVIKTFEKNRGGTGQTPLSQSRITDLQNALAEFDIERADSILHGMQTTSWGEKTDRALEQIENAILVCEYDEALKIATSLADSGEQT